MSGIFVLAAALAASGKAQTLFSCHVNRLYELRHSRSAALTQRSIDGDVRLTVDLDSRTITLIVKSTAVPDQQHSHILKNIEQGSSPGSGTGGRADTVIRGSSISSRRSGDDVYTLFAGYDSDGFDHNAVLKIEGGSTRFLACDGDPYLAPEVAGLGRYASTNVYVLSDDGLAKKMADIPAPPNLAVGAEAP